MESNWVWQLHIKLAQFTPAEAGRITGLSPALQRDWRHRGFGPRYEKHARFTAFDLAEHYSRRVFSDQGKGPTQSAPYVGRIAEAIVSTALIFRGDAWSGERAEEMFDRIPTGSRSFSSEERAEFDHGMPIHEITETIFKRQWVVEQLYDALGLQRGGTWGHQAIWWPTGELEMGSYEDRRFRDLGADGKFTKVDPKYDGPALVLDIEASAEILVDRSPRPWVDSFLLVRDSEPVAKHKVPRNQGDVIVTVGDREVVLRAFQRQ